MYATVAAVPPFPGPYAIPTKKETESPPAKRTPNRAYRRQDELGLCHSNSKFILTSNQSSSEPSTSSPPSFSAMIVEAPSSKKRIIRSPRCIIDDDRLFPTDHRPYQNFDSRWKCISDQAGSHRQDGTVLNITRNLSPYAFSMGLTKHAAKRVKCLNLWLDSHKDTLPQWLDAIADLFVNLQHLTLTQDNNIVFPHGDEDVTVSARMRRLYVLYRLPFLKSIDDEPVSKLERKLSKPKEPESDRLRLDDSMRNDSLLDTDNIEDDEIISDDGYAALAVTESIGNHTASELGAELQELVERLAAVNEVDEDDDDSISEEDDLFAGIELTESELERQLENSGCGEAREDMLSSASTNREIENSKSRGGSDALEVDLSCQLRSIAQRQVPTIQLDENNLPINGVRQSLLEARGSMEEQILRDIGTYEVMSVAASSTHEWTAACGVLSFRSDRTCAPRIRMPFCGRNNNSKNNNTDNREKAKKALRDKQLKSSHKVSSCPPVQRQSSMKSPTDGDGCDPDHKPGGKFFPSSSSSSSNPESEQSTKFFPTSQKAPVQALSANQKIPPSKSLSSPFPLQFRNRPMPAPPPPPIQRVDSGTVLPEITPFSTVRDAPPPPPPPPAPTSPLETIAGQISAISFCTASPHSSPKKQPETLARGSVHKKVPKGGRRSPSNGDLPPPCPGRPRIPPKVAAFESRRARKLEKRRKKSLKASTENARGTSVFDLDDEDDSEESDGDDKDFDDAIYDAVANMD